MTTETVEHWEARAEYDIGRFIAAYMQQNPPPCESKIATDLRASSESLVAAGGLGLGRLGLRPLRLVEDGGA
jgi:hypothetical protein